jgi:hypothetical protein
MALNLNSGSGPDSELLTLTRLGLTNFTAIFFEGRSPIAAIGQDKARYFSRNRQLIFREIGYSKLDRKISATAKCSRKKTLNFLTEKECFRGSIESKKLS